MIQLKRAYESAALSDGRRFLIERLWPRGVKKADLHVEAWLKEVAPSTALRQWFSHDPKKWDEFQRRYRKELSANPDGLRVLRDAAERGTITLVYSSQDSEHNNAVALRRFMEDRPARNSAVRRRPAARHNAT